MAQFRPGYKICRKKHLRWVASIQREKAILGFEQEKHLHQFQHSPAQQQELKV